MLPLLELVLLLLVGISHRASFACEQHHACDDIEETLRAIASNSENLQQLQKLFYPVNGASLPSPSIIVYFLNYTEPLPQQCDAGFYPWESYPAFNTSNQVMEWYLWTMRVVNVIAPPLKILELGLYLPAVTFPFLLNRTCPLVQPTPIACLAVPYTDTPSREMITIELLRIISPHRYSEELQNEHSQGIFSTSIARGIPKADVRSQLHLHQMHTTVIGLQSVFNGLQWICGLGALFVVYCYAESWLQLLGMALEKHKEWLAVFWATVNVCIVTNSYTILKMIVSSCVNANERDCLFRVVAIPAGIALTAIPVIVSFRKFKVHLPHPRMWQLCFPCNCFMLARVYFLLSSWIICFSLTVIPGVHIPYAILLLGSSYSLYATALAAIYLLLPAAICFTAVIYTTDQIFCINPEFRLTVKQGFQQVSHLLIATVAFTGAAAFAASLHFLLLLSKNGQKTQSISATVFVVFSTAFTIVAPWAIRTAVRKMQQVLNHEWEAIHEEISTTSDSTREV